MKTTLTLVLAIILSLQFAAAESFGLELPQQAISTCSCASKSTSFRVFNTNAAQETVTYIVDGIDTTTVAQLATASTYNILLTGEAASFTTASPSRFIISSGEQQQVQLNWRVPCSIKGKKKLTVTVQTDSGTQQIFDLWQEVTKCENINLAPKTNSYSGCPCKTAVFEYVVQNTGDFPEEYTVGADELVEHATVSEGLFVLQPKQAKNIYLYVTPGCGLHGKFEGTFSIKATGSKITAETPYYMDIQPCYSYATYPGEPVKNTTAAFTSQNKTYSFCRNELAMMPLQFKNLAEIPNSYNLKTRQKFASLSTDQIDLASSQTRTVHITPDTSKEGQYIAELQVHTVIGNLKSTVALNYEVINCDTPTVEPDTITIDYSEQAQELAITNTGKRDATYSAILYGPQWARLGEQTITIGPGMSANLAIITRPTNTTEKGKYETTLVLKSNAEYTFSLDINLKSAGSTLEFLMLYKWYMIGALVALIILLALVAAGKKSQKQPKKQPATAQQAEIPGEKLAKKLVLERTEKKVTEQKAADKKIKPKKFATSIFLMFIIAAILAMGYFGYQYYKEPEDLPKQPGYSMFNLTPSNITELPGESDTFGYIKEKYNLLKERLDNAKQRVHAFRTWATPYYKILIYLILAVIALSIIWKLAEKPKLLVALIIVATAILAMAYLLRPIHTEPVIYEQDALLKAVDGGLYGYDPNGNIVNTKNGQAITGKEFLQILESNRETIIESTNMTPEQIDATIESLRIVAEGPKCGITLGKNTQFDINLSQSFYDPDNEKLDYSSTEPEHLLIEIYGDTATLTPEPGYTGVEYIEFYATDKAGLEAASGEIVVCIEESRTQAISTISTWIRAYIFYIAAGVAILAVIILLLRHKEQTEPPRPRKKHR